MDQRRKKTRYYSPSGVALGALIGGPFAGSILLAANFRAANQLAQARWTLVLGALVTTALIGWVILLPQRAPTILVPVLAAVTLGVLAVGIDRVLSHSFVIRDHPRASLWLAAAVGVATFFCLGVMVLAMLFLLPFSQ